MDSFLKFIDIVAWPATVLTLAWFFRTELRTILTRISSVKYKDWEAKFDKGLSQVKEEIGSLTKDTTETEAIEDRLIRLSEVSPRAAILEGWIELEQVLLHMAETYQIKSYSPSRIIQSLRKKEIISKSMASACDTMKKLRNDAAHVPDFVVDEKKAESFIILSTGAAVYLKLKINESQLKKASPGSEK